MKQTYIKPDTAIVNIQLQQMIALSMNDTTKAGHETEVLGRGSRGSVWDDED